MTEPETGQPDWEQLLDEQEASGQSVADWCRSAGVKPHLIYPRKRERAARRAQGTVRTGAPADAATRNEVRVAERRRDRRAAQERVAGPAFAPVKVIAPVMRSRAALRVIAGSRAIEVDGEFDDLVLARLIAVLEALPCS